MDREGLFDGKSWRSVIVPRPSCRPLSVEGGMKRPEKQSQKPEVFQEEPSMRWILCCRFRWDIGRTGWFISMGYR